MAYSIGKTSALQTALKAAVDLAIAELSAGILQGDLITRVTDLRDEFKTDLYKQVDEDLAQQGSSSGPRSSYGGGGGQSSPVTFDEAKSMVLNFGAFKGLTIENVNGMTADEAKTYTSGKYDRAGAEYVKWMAGNRDPKAAFSAARAKAFLQGMLTVNADLAVLAK